MRIADSALVEAAVLSDRYISERFLPDKAIDLVDEAAAKLKMEITSKPEKLDEIDRQVLKLERERLSLSRCAIGPRAEHSPLGRARLAGATDGRAGPGDDHGRPRRVSQPRWLRYGVGVPVRLTYVFSFTGRDHATTQPPLGM